MSRAALLDALKDAVAALAAAPARQRIDFQPYWIWTQTQQEPALAKAKAALEAEAQK
jgi:hypothetical protein